MRRYLRRLEQQMADSAFRAENAGLAQSQQGTSKPGSTNWYFANPALMQQGINEFKRKWGNRTLADNWRRSAASSGNSSSSSGGGDVADDSPELDDKGVPTE